MRMTFGFGSNNSHEFGRTVATLLLSMGLPLAARLPMPDHFAGRAIESDLTIGDAA